MPAPEDKFIRTRATLLHRLKDWKDDASWQDFFETYWKLIYKAAKETGLTDEEAEDVVQETMLAVAKQMPTFKYDSSIGSFKQWLLYLVKWRSRDQVRKRQRREAKTISSSSIMETSDLIGAVADQRPNLDDWWEEEWQQALLEAALTRVKRHIDPEKYQVFDFLVNKSWQPEKISATFNIPVDQIYVIRHRITQMIKDEVAQLEKDMG